MTIYDESKRRFDEVGVSFEDKRRLVLSRI
jgi:hypothetical protein